MFINDHFLPLKSYSLIQRLIVLDLFERTFILFHFYILDTHIIRMQGEPGVDYDDPNLDPLICDICKQRFDSLDTLGEHQKKYHNM